MEIIERISIEDVRAAKPKMIYYAAATCWWTHDPVHLSLTPAPSEAEIARLAETMRLNSANPYAPIDGFIKRSRLASRHRLPCDPRGSMLYQTENIEGFLKTAEENKTHYGRHELRAFMAAHHLNCVVSLEDQRPWSAGSWDDYNDALDRLDRRAAK